MSMLLQYILSVRYEVWVAVGVIVLTGLISLLKRSGQQLPPGPWGLPIVGYILFLNKDAHLQFINLAKKYGNVFSLRLGSELVVVLSDAESIREAYSKPEFLGRPQQSAFSLFGMKSPFFLNDVETWKENSRFVIQTLRDLGLGKTEIESQIQEEINHFREVLKSSNGQPINFVPPLTSSVSNNICALLFGKRYDYDDPERKILDKNLDELINLLEQTAFHAFFPWIRKVPFLGNWLGVVEGYKKFEKSKEIFGKKIEEHKETLDKKNTRDFIDSYLVELEARQTKNTRTTFTDDMLKGCISDVFGAGSETVRTVIGWLMYTMAAYPDIQRKVEKEILDIVGPDRYPEYQDQKSMPYTQAVIVEIMRWKTVVSLNAFRYTLEDTHVAGYDVPAGTLVMANFYAVHHDSRHWEDPDNFKPERFLSPDGKSVQKSPYYMPFSVGKRACPGETMAYMEVFLYLVCILQKFEVRFPEGYKPTFKGRLKFTYMPPRTKISFIPKN